MVDEAAAAIVTTTVLAGSLLFSANIFHGFILNDQERFCYFNQL